MRHVLNISLIVPIFLSTDGLESCQWYYWFGCLISLLLQLLSHITVNHNSQTR